MKNLLIYINPRGSFDEEYKTLAKIQIDNSLRFWDRKDILIVTNFDYEYNGVKTIVVSDDLFCAVHDKASKINVIISLLEKKKLNELTWFHDFDAFQLEPIGEIKLDGRVGFTDYGWSPKWNTGSIFFEPNALEVFKWIKEGVYKYNTDEERVLMTLLKNNTHKIRGKIKRLNITYNLGMRRIDYNLGIADKPIRVIHFHPVRKDITRKFKPLINKELYSQFEKYGFT